MSEELHARIRELEKLVYVPGLWRCPKCRFSLLQSNLNMQDGTVTARDQPGSRCPNCDSPLWRVTERQAGNDMVDRAEEQMNRAVAAEKALRSAIAHIDHMAAWIAAQNAGYSFEGLGEDLPGIRAVLGKAS